MKNKDKYLKLKLYNELIHSNLLNFNHLSKFKFYKGHLEDTVTVTTVYKNTEIQVVHSLSPTVLRYCAYPAKFIHKAESFLNSLKNKNKKINFIIKLKKE